MRSQALAWTSEFDCIDLPRYIEGVDLNAMADAAKASGTLDAFLRMICLLVFKVRTYAITAMKFKDLLVTFYWLWKAQSTAIS